MIRPGTGERRRIAGEEDGRRAADGREVRARPGQRIGAAGCGRTGARERTRTGDGRTRRAPDGGGSERRAAARQHPSIRLTVEHTFDQRRRARRLRPRSGDLPRPSYLVTCPGRIIWSEVI